MKIYRFTYEEIDTNDRYNPDKNTKVSSQLAVSDYELEMLYPNNEEYIRDVKNKALNELLEHVEL